MAESVGRLEATFSLDTTPLSAGLKRASSMLQAWSKRWDDEPNAEVGVDISSLQAGLKQASAALERFDGSTATAKVELDGERAFTRQLQGAFRSLSSVDGREATAKVELEGVPTFTRQAQQAFRALSQIDGREATASIKLDGLQTFTRQLQSAFRSLSAVDGRKAEASVTADTSSATRSFNDLRRQLADLSRSGAALRIQANVQQARRDVQEFVSWAREQRIEMTVSAVTTEAQRAAEIAKTYIDNLSANIDIGANSAAAIAEGRLAAGRINQMSPEFNVGAETSGAMGEVQGVVRRTNAMRGNFDVGANTQPAESELAGFNQTIRRYSRSWGQQGIRARVQADTRQAQAQIRNLDRILQNTTQGDHRVRVEAETARARGQLRGLQQIAAGLGMQDPTVSVGVRGVAASTAQMLGLWKLADRLDGYNVRFNASVDQTISKVLPQALGSLEQQVARFRSIATATAAVTVPMLQTAIASLPGVISMAATAAGSLATRLGAGLVGAVGSVGSAAVLGGAALGAYGYTMRRTLSYAFNLSSVLGDQVNRIEDAKDAQKQAAAAVAQATPGTEKYRKAQMGLAFANQNVAFEQRRMNAMLGFATPKMLKLNAAANDMSIEFIKLGAATSDASAPMLTRWIKGLTGVMQNSRGAIVGMITDMNRVADSFVKTMSKGREFANLSNIFSGIRQAGVPAMQILTSALRLFVNTFAATVPTGLKVLNVLSRVTMAAARWSGTAQGQSKIRTVWQSLAAAGAQLWRIVRDLGIGLGGVIIALNQTGIGQSMMNGLEGVASAFRNVMRAGGEGRAAIVEMGHATRPTLSALADLVGYLGRQFGAMAMEVAKSQVITDTVEAIHTALKGTETSMGIIPMLRHEFEVIGPLLPPLIKQLGLWFSTFAYAQPEMVLFIKTITRVLEAFNSLPQPVQRTMARMLAWGSVIQMLGGTALVGLIAKIVLFRRAMATMRAVQAANGAAMATQAGIFSRMGTAIRGAAAATWAYTRAATMAAARSTAAGVAAAASAIKVRVLSVATRAAAVGMRAMGVAATFMLGPWGLVIAGVIALGAALVIAYRRSEAFRNAVNRVGNFIRSTAVAAFRGLVNAARSVWQWFTKLPGPIQFLISPIGALIANFGRIKNAVVGAAQAIGSFVMRIGGGAISGIQAAWSATVNFLIAAWQRLKAVGSVVFGAIGNVLGRIGRGVVAGIQAAWSGAGAVLGAIWNSIKAVAMAVFNPIASIVRRIGPPLVNAIRQAWANISSWFAGQLPLIRQIFQKHFGFIGPFVSAVFRGILAVGRFVWNTLKTVVTAGAVGASMAVRGNFSGIRNFVGAVFRGILAVGRFVWNALRTVVQVAAVAVVTVVRANFNLLRTIAGAAFRGILAVARVVWPPLRALISGAARGAAAVVRAVWGALTRFWQANNQRFVSIIRSVWNIIRGTINTGVRIIGNIVRLGLQVLAGDWRGAWNTIKRIGQLAWNQIKNVVRNGWNIVKNLFQVGASVIKGVWNGIWGVLKSVARAGWNAIKNGVRSAWNFIKNTTSQVWNGIKNFLNRLWDGLVALVQRSIAGWRRIISGGWNFIKNTTSRIWNGIQNFFGNWWKRLTNLLNRSLDGWKRILSGAWNFIKNLWDRSLSAIRSRTDSWRSALRNLFDRFASWIRDRWNSFWSGLKGLWDRSLRAVGNRTESWRDALRALMDRIAKWVRNRWNSFWSGLKGLWDRSLSAIRSRTDSWRDALRSLMDRIAKWVRDRWNSFWSGLRGLWDRSLSAIRSRTDSWRDALRNLFDRIAKWARGRWDDFWSGMRNLWDNALSKIGDRARSWGQAIKSLFLKVKGWMTSPMEKARDILKGIWNGILGGIGKVLGAVGLDDAASKVNGAKWATGGTTQDGGGQAFANGGTTLRKFASGGMGTSTKQPRMHLWNEQMGNEAYITERGKTRDQIKYLNTAAGWHGAKVVPQEAPHRTPTEPPPAGSHSHINDAMSRAKLRKRSAGTRGAHPDFSRNHKNVYDYIRDRADKVAGAMGVSWNTYHHHITAPGANEHSSVDFWGGGPGVAIGSSKGSATANYVVKNFPEGNLGTIWNRRVSTGGGWRPFGGGPHLDHVHVGWSTDPNAPIVSGGGIGGMSIPNPMQILFDKMWNNTVGRTMDGFRNRMKGGHVLRQGTAGAATMVTQAIHKWIDDKIPDTIGGGGSGGPGLNFEGGGTPQKNRDLGRKMSEAMGWGSQFGSLDKLWKKESGWNQFADNPTSAAYGIPQANPGRKMSSSGPKWKTDPATQIDWGLGYIKGRYGDPSAAWGHSQRVGWYQRGGVVPGFRPTPAVLHGGERVLPRDLNVGFESLSRSIDSWNSRGASAPSVDVGGSEISRLEKKFDALMERLDEGLDVYERNGEELADFALNINDSPAGQKRHERRNDSQFARRAKKGGI